MIVTVYCCASQMEEKHVTGSELQQLCVEGEGMLQQASNDDDEECRVMFERELSFCSSRCRDVEDIMDDSLWKRLPEDLLERVLAWLPLASCVRFRSVCKRWYAMMYSQSFLELRSKEAPVCGPSWLLSFGSSLSSQQLIHDVGGSSFLEGNVFDTSSNSCFKLQFPFLPQDSVLVATAGGLVCFCCNTNESHETDVSFYVCNPITKAWKLIPSQCSKVSVVAMLVNTESSSFSTSYKLIVFCEASTDRWLWMGIVDHAAKEYDSKLNRWKSIGGIYSGEQFRPGSVYCEGRVHLLSSETVQALDVQQGIWTDIQAPAYTSCARLVECQDRLLLVGDMVHLNVFQLPGVSSYIGVVIWELDPDTQEWVEIGRMPEDMVENFCCSSFCCVVSGGLIYIFPKLERLQQIVVYDYSQQTWQQLQNWLKELPSSVFCFEPRLDASA